MSGPKFGSFINMVVCMFKLQVESHTDLQLIKIWSLVLFFFLRKVTLLIDLLSNKR